MIRGLSRWFLLTLGTLIVGGASSAPLGLLDQPQTFPWSVGLAPVVQEEAGGLAAGQARLRSSALWFNTFRQAGLGPNLNQMVDMEGVLETLSGAWSPTTGWEIRCQLQGWTLGGGVMDGFLEAVHRALGVSNQGREYFGSQGYRNYLKGVIDDRSPSMGLTQGSLGARWFGGPWSATWWVKPPVPGHLGWAWSDRWGGGLSLGWGDRWPVPAWAIQLKAGVTGGLLAVQPDDFYAPTSPWTYQAGGYTIVELFSGPRLLAQASYTRVPREGADYLAQGAGLLTTGIQWPIDGGWLVEGALTEEFLTWATMEVGFQAGVAWTF